MNLQSPKATLNKTPQDIFDFLFKVENFEKLMPENISKFEVVSEDKFLFALKGMPEIILKRKETEAPHKIVLGAAGGNLNFSLIANIVAINDTNSEVQLEFNGKFNTMMAMMIKSPLSKFIETLVTNLKTAI